MAYQGMFLLFLLTAFLSNSVFFDSAMGHPNPKNSDPGPGSDSDFKCKKYRECQVSFQLK